MLWIDWQQYRAKSEVQDVDALTEIQNLIRVKAEDDGQRVPCYIKIGGELYERLERMCPGCSELEHRQGWIDVRYQAVFVEVFQQTTPVPPYKGFA